MTTKSSQVRTTYKHNDLFRPGCPVNLNACVGNNGGPYDFDDYARGYFEAAVHIVKGILTNQVTLDIGIYPVVFNYRHAIELALKDLAIQLPRFWNEEGAIKLTHSLLDNWTVIRAYLQREEEFDPAGKLISAIDTILSDFLEIDPKGEVFRYPKSRDGDWHLAGTTLINLVVFAETMETVESAFDYWMWRTRDLLEYKAEMESEDRV